MTSSLTLTGQAVALEVVDEGGTRMGHRRVQCFLAGTRLPAFHPDGAGKGCEAAGFRRPAGDVTPHARLESVLDIRPDFRVGDAAGMRNRQPIGRVNRSGKYEKNRAAREVPAL